MYSSAYQTWIEDLKLMEKEGFYCALIPEFGNQRDTIALSALGAVETKNIKLGLFVVPYIKHPVVIASSVATIDEISNGRAFMILGLGGFMTLRSLGIKTWEQPLAALRETTRIVRDLFNNRSVDFDGKMYSPKGAKLGFTANKDIPIFIAAMSGEKILNMAGEVADGVLLAGPYGKYTKVIIDKVKESAKNAGRDPDRVKIAMDVVFLSYEDGEKAVDTIKPFIAKEILLDPRLRPAVDAEGIDVEELERVIRKGNSGAELITDEIVDAFAVAGSPDYCVERFKELERMGVDISIPYSPWALVPPEPLRDKIKMIGERIIPEFE